VKSRLNAFLGLVLALGLVAAACQPGQQAPQVVTGGTFRVELSEPGSLDPMNADSSEESVIVRNTFEMLVNYDDETAELEPGVATKWEANDDFTVWTYTLRDDAVFSNDEPVDAESFVRAWTRTTAQASESELGYHLAGIKGYTEHFEEGAPTLSGVEAVNKTTFRVTLTEPDPEFAIKSGHTAFAPIPSDATIAGQKPSFAENSIGNGPFMLKQPDPWKHNQSVTMVPNPKYVGPKKKPVLDEVVFVILADFDTAYLEWQAGNLDWTRIDPAKLAEAEAQNAGNFIKEATSGFNYLAPNASKPPSDNKLFRQAVSLAVDRDGINRAIFNGLQQSADSILPPIMPGYRKGACELCRYDPAQAKQLFQQSGVPATTILPMYFNSGAGHEQWMQAVADNIKTNLGIETRLEGIQPFSAYLRFLGSPLQGGSSAPGSVNRLAWGMDYPTPWNFLWPLVHSKSADNHSNYTNPAFEAKIAEANKEKDPADRIKIYQQAEDILLEDMAFIPLWFRVQFRLTRLDQFTGLAMDWNEWPTLTTISRKATSP
jgi:oligopeptide transport system substrate-binding protein